MFMRALCLLVAAAACGRVAPPPTLAVAQRVEHLDRVAREPMIVEHPSGALFVSAYNMRQPALWKSTDGGASWARADLGTEADGAIGTSDCDLA